MICLKKQKNNFIIYLYLMKQSWQDTIWQTVVQISSFPGFALPITLYALLVQDVSSIVAFLLSLFILAIVHLILKAILRTPRPV